MTFLPIKRMSDRIAIERSDSDLALFNALMYTSEMVTKLTAAGMIAAIGDDSGRIRERSVRRLLRADGLGEWVDALDELLIGPPSQYLDPSAREAQRQLNQNCDVDTWQYQAVKKMHECLVKIKPDIEPLGARTQGRHWFRDFVQIRNSTRGHGAAAPSKLEDICPDLEESIELFTSNFDLFDRPWAYVYRNMSGRYRVTPWGPPGEYLESLTRRSDVSIENGVYVQLEELRKVALVESTPDAQDIWIANGAFTVNHHQFISYVTDDKIRRSSEEYLVPLDSLPTSETQGVGVLEALGNCFTNVPSPPQGYVDRPILEEELERQLMLSDRHPIVTLTGRGGIGKTSTALHIIHAMMLREDLPYELIIWFSSRDVDLTIDGPKTVEPHGVSLNDFALEYAKLVAPERVGEKGFKPIELLGADTHSSSIGPTLFVFDNFETTSNRVEIFNWLDNMIRPPNKILITSRERNFTGDYAVTVGGMDDQECRRLIDSTSEQIGIASALQEGYIQELIRESNGHPYIIRLLLGEASKTNKFNNVERIVAGLDEALVALFERSFNSLTPGAKRVFLTASNWRSSVPALGLEAVLLRPENDRINVQEAIEELVRTSFVEVIDSDVGDEFEVDVPLAARIFGRKRLETSELRASIQVDTELLQLFGAAQNPHGKPSLEHRVQRLFGGVATIVSHDIKQFNRLVPILEYVSRRYPYGWILLAELMTETFDQQFSPEIERLLLRYVENPDEERYSSIRAWLRIADLKRDLGDPSGELHALAQVCRQRSAALHVVSNTANRINGVLRSNVDKDVRLRREEKQFLLADVVSAMENHLSDLDATDCSRLAWLYVHLDQDVQAIEVAQSGLDMDPDNGYCYRLIQTLNYRLSR